MNIKKLSIIFLFISLYSSTLRVIPPQSKYDTSHFYFTSLLQLILENTNEKFGKKVLSYSKKLEQGRAFIKLKNKQDIDIYWAGSSIKREEEFNTIKIPLLKGLLGYRLLIINKKNIHIFKSVDTIDDLKKLKACQGKYWPDTDILLNSGFNVIKNVNYEAMFLQVQKNRCDYFPRGIHEINSEMKARKNKYPDLMIYNKLIIYYPFPMYFFLSKQNNKLKNRIQIGLENIILNGQFLKHLKENITTKHIFPLKSWQNVKIFKIKNHLLSKQTNFKDKKLWITPPK